MIHNTFKGAILDLFTKGTYTDIQSLFPASNAYLGLFTTVPSGPTDSGTEVSTSGTAYTRVLMSASYWPDAGSVTSITNSAEIPFAQATASWGTVNAWGLWGNASLGDWLINSSPATFTGTTVNNGDIARFASGALTWSVS